MKPTSGFTLIELMTTLGITALMVTIGIPSFSMMRTNYLLTSNTNTFVTALHQTRAEAIGRETRVTMCKKATDTTCSTSAQAANDNWSNGWIIFVDDNNDGLRNSGETIIRVQEELSGNMTLQGDTGIDKYISFIDKGHTQKVDSTVVAQAGDITLCHELTQKSRVIHIKTVGRLKTTEATCS